MNLQGVNTSYLQQAMKGQHYQSGNISKDDSDGSFRDQLLQKLHKGSPATGANDRSFTPVGKSTSEKEDQRLKEVTEQFESLFVNMIFKEMRKSLNKHKLIDGGMGEKIFKDMLYQKYSEMTAKKADLGIAELLYDQLNK